MRIKKILVVLLTLSLAIGLLPVSFAVATGAVTDFENTGFTLSTSGTYPWVVEEKDGEDVLTATYGEMTNPFSTLEVSFSETGVFSFEYSTATGGTMDVLLYSFEEITTSTDYNKAENNNEKSDYSGIHDWTTTQVNISAGDTLYFVFAKKTPGSTEGHVWLRNLSLETQGFTVSVSANDDDYGSAEASVYTVAADAADKTATFTATAASGYRFYGWVDDNGHFLSAENPYAVEVLSSLDVVAWFGAEDQYAARVDGVFYEDVADAIGAADGGTASAPAFVVLTGNAGISGNVTLNPYTVFILPYTDLDTHVDLDENTSDRPFANWTGASSQSSEITQQGQNVTYTLMIDEGASLTVPNSSVLAVGGTCSGKQPIGGQVCGPHSEIDVEGELNINGGVLSCCGYIYGDGDIFVSNGTVYENFTVLNYNGGNIFTHDATVGLFPFTTYTVMGIQCQTTLDADSGLRAYCLLYAEGNNQQIPVEVVGSNKALIQMSSGYAVMKYDDTKTFTVAGGGVSEEVGILNIKIYGDASIGSLKLSLGTFSVDTQDFECPLPYCITIEQVTGTLDMSARLRVMPGSQLLIGEDATLNVGYGGSLNALLDNDAYEAISTNHYTYPDIDTLVASGYYPIAEVVVAGTLTVEDGAGIGGLIMVLDGGTVEVSEYANTDINLSDIAMLINVTEDELDMTTPEFAAMMYNFSVATAPVDESDPNAVAAQQAAMYALMQKAAFIDVSEGGQTYTPQEGGGFANSGYTEQTYTDTITFVDDDYLGYLNEHEGSAEGYEPLAVVTQERHTALVYPSGAPVPHKDIEEYDVSYNERPFIGWNKIVFNPLGLPIQELDDDNQPKLYTTLPDVIGDAVYMAAYGDQWKYFIYTFTFEDGVNGADITMPDPVQTDEINGNVSFASITEPTYDGYTFTGWKCGNVVWQSGSKSVYDVQTLADENRMVTWTAQWDPDPNAAETLTLDNFVNRTGGTPIAAIDVTDAAAGTFTVTCAKACIVIIETDNGGVKSYEKVPYNANVAANTYSFEAHLAEGQKVLVALKGDVNGDGMFDSRDQTYLQRGLLETTHRRYVAFTPLEAILGDTNEDGVFDSRDETRMARALLETTHRRYLPVEW